MDTLKFLFALLIISCSAHPSAGQQDGYMVKSIKSFGAKGDGKTNDHAAFQKAAAFFNARKGNGKLVIEKGTYLVGKQTFIKDNPDKYAGAYTGDAVLDIHGCSNFTVEGKKGSILKFNAGLRQGTFSPETGKPFFHDFKDIYNRKEYRGYRSTAGIAIKISNCDDITIKGLSLDGNMDGLVLGGTWGIGSNAYELEHYGIYILDASHINLNNLYIHHFAVDGICIINKGQERKTTGITLSDSQVNYPGRNGLSWVGGDSVSVYRCSFENSARGKISESPAAGMDIEVENNSFCTNGYFEDCRFIGSKGSALTSGSKEKSKNMRFKNCTFASPLYYTIVVDAPFHVFEDCKFYGSVLVWQRATTKEDATYFKQCSFEETYKGIKMYDARYLFGAEATGIYFDSCQFNAQTTACFYLASHADNCDEGNPQKFFLKNCLFKNTATTQLALAPTVAGIAHHSEFTNCRFYAHKGYTWEINYRGNCFANRGGNQFYQIP